MTHFTPGNAPGLASQRESAESQIWWAGRGGQSLIATQPITLAAAAVDAGNTPSTTLRAGNVLAIVSATGKATLYDPDGNDGSQIAVGLLERGQDMLVDGVATDRCTQMLVHGLAKEGELIGLDLRARQQLSGRFVFDSSLGASASALGQPRGVARKSANYSVLASDQNLLFLATAAVTFTLPAKQNGLAFRFAQTANANLVISGSADIVHKGNAAANTVTFSTANEKIGSQALVECVYTATNTLVWLVTNLGGTTATVA